LPIVFEEVEVEGNVLDQGVAFVGKTVVVQVKGTEDVGDLVGVYV
jgi:hypothetical protein